MTRILIVEDEAGLRQGLEINLRHENYETVTAGDGEEAIRLFHSESPDLVLLDLMLPKKSGFEVLDHIRKISKVPVILLTARGQETDKVRGLRSGADDYVTKPFGLQELFARIDAVMRRSEAIVAQKSVCEDTLIKLDPSTREASAKNQKLKLSPKEFDLLMYLFKNKERVVPRDELLSRVWNYRVDLNLNSRTVDTHVTRLRRKLQKAVGTDSAVIVAVSMIREAEKAGELRPGSTVIEATSGNTGIGLAFVAAARGYRCVLIMPDTMSVERRKLLEALGAQLILTPGPKGIKEAQRVADEILAKTPGGWLSKQFDNPANLKVHRETTAQEILRDTGGKLDAVVAGVGTGGTITGIGQVFKKEVPHVITVAVEPIESQVLKGGTHNPHKIQGIGAGMIPSIYDAKVVDRITDVQFD